MKNEMFVVEHYFPDVLNRLSYYPGETFSTEDLLKRGMTEADVANYVFRDNLKRLDTAPPAEPVNVEMNLLMDAASNQPETMGQAEQHPLGQADQRTNPVPRPELATTEQPAEVLAQQEKPPVGLQPHPPGLSETVPPSGPAPDKHEEGPREEPIPAAQPDADAAEKS